MTVVSFLVVSPQSDLQMLAAHHLLLHWHAGILNLDFSKAFRTMFVELGLEYSALTWPVWLWELGLPRLRIVSSADALGPISASDNAAAGAQGRTRCSGSRHACSCYMTLLLSLLGCKWQTFAFGVLYGSVSDGQPSHDNAALPWNSKFSLLMRVQACTGADLSRSATAARQQAPACRQPDTLPGGAVHAH